MVTRGQLEADVSQGRESLPELRNKELVTVGNDVGRQAVLTIPRGEEQSRKVFSRHVGSCRNEAYIAVQSIGDGRNTVKTVVFRKRSDEVNCNTIVSAIRHRKRMEGASRFTCEVLVPLTVFARGYVEFFNLTTHVRPIIP